MHVGMQQVYLCFGVGNMLRRICNEKEDFCYSYRTFPMSVGICVCTGRDGRRHRNDRRP